MAEIVDLPALAVSFGHALRAAGVAVTPERSARFARTLALSPPTTRDELYWTARIVFVSTHEQIPSFDRVFGVMFDGIADVADTRGDSNVPPVSRRIETGDRQSVPGSRPISPQTASAQPFQGMGHSGPHSARKGQPRETVLAVASSEERLSERNFAELDDDELIAVERLLRRLALTPPKRRSRRARLSRRGERLDLRATLRRSRRTGGDPIRLARRRRRLRSRSLVVICDISGSMEPYTRAFLQFLHGAVGGADAEAFVFATRLTRLTHALSGRQPQLAIERAAAAASDWSGGTRIGEALHRFNKDYGRQGMARGAVVVILSDAWERDDPERLAVEMASLRRLAYRIVWVNPRKASPRFAPLAAGMAAALPHCDALLSGHSLSALETVADVIGASRVQDGL